MILGFRRPDGTRYTTLPDVFVYRTPIAPDRPSLSLKIYGPPALVIEVASESTYDSDLDLEGGKGWTYAQGGVREYMVLDPTGMYVSELIRAWRLEGGIYQPWHAEADGRWHSQELPIAITIEEGTAAVYSGDGRRQLREGEISAELDRLRRRIEELEQG
jgi:Uma2 family endonuclease